MLSDRVGHAHPGITYTLYTHRSRGKDRPIADQIGSLLEQALTAKNPLLATDAPSEGSESDAARASEQSDDAESA